MEYVLGGVLRFASETKGWTSCQLESICNILNKYWDKIQYLVNRAEEQEKSDTTELQKNIAWHRVELARNRLEDVLDFCSDLGLRPIRDTPYGKGYKILDIGQCIDWQDKIWQDSE